MNADASAQGLRQQVIDLYFCAEVKDFDTCQVTGFDISAQVRGCDDLAEVKVFGTWLDELVQTLGQSLQSLICEVSLVVYQWILLYCSVYFLCLE